MLSDLNLQKLFDMNLNEEYKILINDLIKYVTIVTILNCMFFLRTKIKFLNMIYIDMLSFIIVSLCAYHLIVKKIIKV